MHEKTWSIPEVASLLGLVILLFVSQVAADTSWTYKIVSDPTLNAINADISGDYLIYSGSIGDPILENSTRVIQLYSLPTGAQTRIATSSPGSVLTGEDIDGNYAVWFSEPVLESQADTPNRIFLYKIAEKNLTVIRTSEGAGWAKVSGECVIWSESAQDSFNSSIMRYDIGTGNTSLLTGINTFNGADVAFDGNYILYSDADTMKLLLYATSTGSTVTVFAPSADNNTREIVFGTALGGDYVLYRKDVNVEKPKDYYSELCLYTISTGKTTLLSPQTGEAIETLSGSDKNANFDAQAADKTRVAWKVTEGLGDDRIMVLDPATMTVSSVSPKTFVDFVHLDGLNMTWLGSESLGENGSIYLAMESAGQGPVTTTPTRAPGFGLIITVGGLLAGLFAARKM